MQWWVNCLFIDLFNETTYPGAIPLRNGSSLILDWRPAHFWAADTTSKGLATTRKVCNIMSADDLQLKVTPNHIHESSSQLQAILSVQNCLSPQPQIASSTSSLLMASTSAPPPQLARPYDSVSYVRIRRNGMRITGVSLGVPLTERTRPYTLCFIGATPAVAPSAAPSATLARDVKSDSDMAAACSSSGDSICNVGSMMSMSPVGPQIPIAALQECAPSPSILFTLSPHSDVGTLTNTASTTPSSTAPVSPQAATDVASPSLSSGDAFAGLTAGGTGISSSTSSTRARQLDEVDLRTRSGVRNEGGGDSKSTSTSICGDDNGSGRNRNWEPSVRPGEVSDSGRTSLVSADEYNEPGLETPTPAPATVAHANVLEGRGLHMQNAIVPVFPVFVRRITHQNDTEWETPVYEYIKVQSLNWFIWNGVFS